MCNSVKKRIFCLTILLTLSLTPCLSHADLISSLETYLMIKKGIIDTDYLSAKQLKDYYWIEKRLQGFDSSSRSSDDLSRKKFDSCEPPITTRIDSNSFSGWDGDTVFLLQNGEIWKQDEYDYEYGFAFQPEVLIYSSSGRCLMYVPDLEEEVSVRRIK